MIIYRVILNKIEQGNIKQDRDNLQTNIKQDR